FGGGILTQPGSSSEASFILKLDTAGKFKAGLLLQNGTILYPSGNFLNGVAVDSSGVFSYLTGSIQGDTIFCGSDTLYNGPNIGCYVARASWTIPGCINFEEGISEITSSKPNALLYPNPNTGKFIVQLSGVSGQSVIEIYNILGEKVFTKPLSGNTDKYSFDLTSQSSGIYLYRIISESGQLINDGKFIIE
ncbi:MAG TPA: T9SS type A sorting domain-containing protein, partial [Bacteroidia bacterium]|nr:T9SS type A sorting domain-containing protein [Bacteroidia bacterium]